MKNPMKKKPKMMERSSMKLDDVMKSLEPIAKGLGVAVTEVWKIYCRQYFVRGVTELITAIITGSAVYFLMPLVTKTTDWLWLIIPLGIASMVFLYSAIPLLFNLHTLLLMS